MLAATVPSPLPPMPCPRGGACGHIIHGSFLVIGGGLSAKEHLDRVDSCSLATGIWSARAPMPTPRSNASSAVLDGKIIVVGGLIGPVDDDAAPCSAVESFDPAANAWTRLAPLPFPRVRPAVAAVGGRLIVIGGRRDDLDTPVIAAYDPKADRWSEIGTTPFPARHAAGVTLDGKVLVAGGFQALRKNAEDKKGVIIDAFYAVDPVTGSCTPLAPLPEPRASHALVVANGLVHALGGMNRDKQMLTAIDIYDPATKAWKRSGNIASGRAITVAAVHQGAIHLLSGWTRMFKESNPASDVVLL